LRAATLEIVVTAAAVGRLGGWAVGVAGGLEKGSEWPLRV
jgi:hypothetical protein